MQYDNIFISVINENLHVFTWLCYTFIEKNGIFTLKMRYQNKLILPQNGRNRVSKDLKFKKFPGENTPGLPY